MSDEKARCPSIDGSPRSSAAYRRPRVRQSPSKPKPMRDLSASPRETSASAPTSPTGARSHSPSTSDLSIPSCLPERERTLRDSSLRRAASSREALSGGKRWQATTPAKNDVVTTDVKATGSSAATRPTPASHAQTPPPQRPRTDTARDTFSLIRLTTGTTAKERGLHMPLILAGVAAFFAGIAFTLLSRR